MQSTHKIILTGAVLLLAGVAVAFAHGGRWGGGNGGHMGGYGGHMMDYGSGYGMGPGGAECPGYGYGPGMRDDQDYGRRGYGADLTQEQRDKLAAARDEFFTETEQLREQIRDQRYALRNEMSKKDPDADKVTQLQKELSDLQSQFDQKAVQHRLEVRKILPENTGAFGYGRGDGAGYGRNRR